MSTRLQLLDAEEYILNIFKICNIIALGEGLHGLENSHVFFRKLFDNKKIQEILDVVIVEFANVDYQSILDDYIFGKEVDIKNLRKIWRESTQSPGRFGEAPVYLAMLQKIREVNFSLPPEKKIRVLGGDPSIDWNATHTLEEYLSVIKNRRSLPAELAIEYGIQKNQKVLVIYSGFHLTKVRDKSIDQYGHTITSLVIDKYANSMKVIVIEILNQRITKMIDRVEELPLYSVIDFIKNATIGSLPASDFFDSIYNKDGKPIVLFKNNKLKDIFDALLYVGEEEKWKISENPKSTFTEAEWNELNRRRKIIGREPLL